STDVLFDNWDDDLCDEGKKWKFVSPLSSLLQARRKSSIVEITPPDE
ncbi:9968_t:CDS:2, partial [Dentiscutata heterogama]